RRSGRAGGHRGRHSVVRERHGRRGGGLAMATTPAAGSSSKPDLNIVLMVLDTQRADKLGCYGDPRPISPHIDAVAADGVVFERCYAPNIPTPPSFTTMLTGKEAITHDIVNIGGKVPIREGIRLLPEILSEAGYATAAI